jgi:hypothetical protein
MQRLVTMSADLGNDLNSFISFVWNIRGNEVQIRRVKWGSERVPFLIQVSRAR